MRIQIDNMILYNYELNLDKYDELYLPNCIEIINSFKNENNTIKRIIAPKLTTIDCVVSFKFMDLKELIMPNIKNIDCCHIIHIYDGNQLEIITKSKFASSYPFSRKINLQKANESTSNIYKDIENCYPHNMSSNTFHHCTIYATCIDSKFYDSIITLNYIINIHDSNKFYNCEIPHLGFTVNKYDNINK